MAMSYSPSSSLPSSPSSSPSFGPIDSSPPSSPSHNPIQLDDDSEQDSRPGSPEVVHPFAGNSKAVKRFRLYEKRDQRWGADMDDDALLGDDEDATTFAASVTAYAQSDSEFDDFFADNDVESTIVDEREVWERMISEAIDEGNGLIDLSSTSFGGAITSIPHFIADLEKLVVLPSLTQPRLSPAPGSVTSSPNKPSSSKRTLTRAATAPVVFGGRGGNDSLFSSRLGTLGGKAASGSLALQSSVAAPPNEIQLYIAKHSITSLPTELFWITKLTVLSLRSNKLTVLPPQIATALPNLRELNVSLNELTYLPAEILGLRLESLAVAGNPWMTPPSRPQTNSVPQPPAPPFPRSSLFRKPLHIGVKTYHFTVPPLTEFCLRLLMSPAIPTLHTTCLASHAHIPPQKRELTVLETKYELPLVRTDFPAHIIDLVHGCIPRSITDQRKDDGNTGIQASPAKKARLDRPSPSLGLDPFVLPTSTRPPTIPPLFSPTRSTSQPRTRTRSHASSIFSSHSRASTSRPLDPPIPAHPGISVCPSPIHLNQEGKPVYVSHAVERFTWENEIAGVVMGDAEGGVPVLWRGCGPRCLDWLDENDTEEERVEVGAGGSLDGAREAVASQGLSVTFQLPDLSAGLEDAFYASDG